MWERIINEEVRRRCGVENLEHRLRKTKLRWFGHVKCRDENIILRSAMELWGRIIIGSITKTEKKISL